MLPYGRQEITPEDVQAVVEVMNSDFLTQGPMVPRFEEAFANTVGAKYAVAVSSGTAALHAAMYAIGIVSGDEVIVPPITFAATANCVLFQGGTPVFVDVDSNTLLLDPAQVEAHITTRTKAIIAVDYAGHPCDYDTLRAIADRHGLFLVADACHALGGSFRGRPIGSLADLTVFSFHPVKHITTGEGGMVTTNDPELARRIRIFRNHGITTDYRQREQQGSWFYEMVDLGYNYRLPDLNCALGLSQLNKLDGWLRRRREIAERYRAAFANLPAIELLEVLPDTMPAWHLFVIKLNLERLRVGRKEVFAALRAENIGVNVHYIPVYWHPYYQNLGYRRGLCLVAETAYEQLITLPMFHGMTDQDVNDVISACLNVVKAYHK